MHLSLPPWGVQSAKEKVTRSKQGPRAVDRKSRKKPANAEQNRLTKGLRGTHTVPRDEVQLARKVHLHVWCTRLITRP